MKPEEKAWFIGMVAQVASEYLDQLEEEQREKGHNIADASNNDVMHDIGQQICQQADDGDFEPW